METTKSGKVILNKCQTYFQEIKEARKAMDALNKQVRQVPSYGIGRIVLLIACQACVGFLVRSSGFVTGVAQEKTDLYCRRESKAVNVTPVFTCEKVLPKTGAELN